MKTLTVITTTYNRGYCLHQVYDSLCRQTSDDFIWLIVDDGSTDDTREIVEQWIHDGDVEIEYFYKPNGGMHTARNLAYEKVYTELNVIIDSDDWMTDNAVELIVDCWRKENQDRYYGIIANNIDRNHCIIGTDLPYSVKEASSREIFRRFHVKGDKKIILRSELSRLYPYPEFEGEKFYPASYKFRHLDQTHKLLILHEAVCIVDYTADSMTFHKYAQYRTCCQGFAHYRKEIIKLSKEPREIIDSTIHYIAESKYAKDKHYIKNSVYPFVTLSLLPVGLLYYRYLEKTNKEF